MNIYIIYLGHDKTYIIFEDYINYIKKKLKYHVVVSNFNNIIKDDITANDIVICYPLHQVFIYRKKFFSFIKQISCKKTYLINTEQLTRKKKNFTKMIRFFYKRHYKIIDYSEENKLFFKNSIIFPFYYCNLNIKIPKKENYVCMIGNNSPKRNKLLNTIKKLDIPIKNIIGFGVDRDIEVMKSKILINCHYKSDYKILEQIRINPYVLNKLIIITENGVNNELYEFKKNVIFCEYENIPEMVKCVLNNYDYYHNKLFSNFNIDKYKNYEINDFF